MRRSLGRRNLMRTRAEDRIVVVKAVELVAVNVGRGVHEVNVALDALRAANLQNVDPRRRQNEEVRLQKAERRVGGVAFADIVRVDVRKTRRKDRILFVRREVGHAFPRRSQSPQDRLEGSPIGGRFRIDHDALAGQFLSFAPHPEDELPNEGGKTSDEEVARRGKAHDDRKEHAPRARVEIGPGFERRRDESDQKPEVCSECGGGCSQMHRKQENSDAPGNARSDGEKENWESVEKDARDFYRGNRFAEKKATVRNLRYASVTSFSFRMRRARARSCPQPPSTSCAAESRAVAIMPRERRSETKAFTCSGSGRDQGEPSTAFTGM